MLNKNKYDAQLNTKRGFDSDTSIGYIQGNQSRFNTIRGQLSQNENTRTFDTGSASGMYAVWHNAAYCGFFNFGDRYPKSTCDIRWYCGCLRKCVNVAFDAKSTYETY